MVRGGQRRTSRSHRGWHNAGHAADGWLSTKRQSELYGIPESSLTHFAREAFRKRLPNPGVRRNRRGHYEWDPKRRPNVHVRSPATAPSSDGALHSLVELLRGPVETFLGQHGELISHHGRLIGQQDRLIDNNTRLVQNNERLVLRLDREH